MSEGVPRGDGSSPAQPSAADQWARSLLERMAPMTDVGSAEGVVARLEDLCGAVTAELDLAGAVVAVHSAGGGEAMLVAAGGEARTWAQLEFDLGEGPALDSLRLGRPVLVSDLAGAESRDWPGYAAAALEAGLCGVLALPLQVGATRLGVVSLYLDDVWQLDDVRRARVFAVADLMTTLLLDVGETGPATGGVVGPLRPALESALMFRSEVYQAQGAVMVALGISLPEALARLRAHAFASGKALDGVAVDIVEGRLTLDPDGPPGPADPHPTEDVQP